MTSIERTAYPRFKIPLTNRELIDLYTPLEDEIALAQTTVRGDSQKLTFVVLLKSFQNIGYFPALNKVPDFIIDHIREMMDLPEYAQLTEAETSLYRNHSVIRNHLMITRYSEGGEEITSTTIHHAALTMNNPADLINAAIEELFRQHFELPAYSHLDRLAGHIRSQVNEAWYQMVEERLSDQERDFLDHLPQLNHEATRTTFTLIKQPPGKAVLSQMRLTLKRLRWIEGVFDTRRILAGLPPTRIEAFAEEARALESGDIVRYSAPYRYTLLVCLLHEAQSQTRDNLARMVIKRLTRAHHSAQETLDTLREQQRVFREQMLETMMNIIRDTATISDDTELGFQTRQRLNELGDIQDIYDRLNHMSRYHGNNLLPLMVPHFQKYRSMLFDILEALDIRSTSQNQYLFHAIAFIKRHRNRRSEFVSADITIPFASRQWQDVIYQRHEGAVLFNRRYLEVCVFSYVAAELGYPLTNVQRTANSIFSGFF